MASESVALTLGEKDRLGELMANAIAVADLLQSAGEGGAEVPSRTLTQIGYMLRNQLQEASALTVRA